MSFPIPRLDERSFQDFVDEAKRRIPHHTPEWTDHNVSDPGVALIELFSWMTESIVYRLNMVPDQVYRSFLDLVGVSPYPPQAARTLATFWANPEEWDDLPRPRHRDVPLGSRVSTTQDQAGNSVEFLTQKEITIREPVLTTALRGQLVARDVGASREQLGGVWELGVFKAKEDERIPDTDYTTVAREVHLGPEPLQEFRPASPFTCFPARIERDRTGVEDANTTQDPAPVLDDGIDQAVYFGFRDSLAGHVLQIDVETAGVMGNGVHIKYPPLLWEVSTGPGKWERAVIEPGDDATNGLNTSGRILLYLPTNHSRERCGEHAFWLRVRLTDAEEAYPGEREAATSEYSDSPILTRVGFRTVGVQVPVHEGQEVGREELGLSNGKPGQSFRVLRYPVLDRRRFTLADRAPKVEKRLGDGTTRTDDLIPPGKETLVSVYPNGTARLWEEVDNFAHSTKRDRHFTWDSATGEIRLGPLVREADVDEKITQRGYVPPADTRLYVTGYRSGGGQVGNVPADSIVIDQSGLPWVRRVNNRREARGGIEAETIENAKVRGPLTLISGDRAVTKHDYEHLIERHHPQIGRVVCLPAIKESDNGLIKVRIVRRSTRNGQDVTEGDFTPSDERLRSVKEMLETRRMIGAKVQITPAKFRGVSIVCRVVTNNQVDEFTTPEIMKRRCLEELYRFLHPITGGQTGEGWPWGKDIERVAIDRVLHGVVGVERVPEILLFHAEYEDDKLFRNPRRLGAGKEIFALQRGELPISIMHKVVIETSEGGDER